MKSHLLVASLLVITFLSGCMEAKIQDKSTIRQLEAEGKLPKLDRTDTLTGIDEDQNGVRDDIDAFIKLNYPEPELAKAATDMAWSFQMAINSDHSDRALQKSIADKLRDADQCFSYLVENSPELTRKYGVIVDRKKFGGTGTYVRVKHPPLEALSANTKSRLRAYLRYNRALDGTVATYVGGNTCDK